MPTRAIILCLISFRLLSAETGATKGTEILWDRYGVPHIFARDRGSAFFALGYAQMQSHANLLLELYGEARGRAAEYWGAKYLENDLYIRTVNAPARAKQWQAQQTPEFRGYLDQFAAGINAYAQEHPDQISAEMKRVLPVSGLDVLLHAERVMYFTYIAPPRRVGFTPEPTQGSNAWAIAPAHSASRHAMLLANPHQTWSGAMLFWEAHIVTPGLNLYGAMQIGFPVMRYAFNDHLGFCQTVNTIDVADVYRLTLKDGGYLFDGAVRSFETEKATVQVRRADGSLAPRDFTIRHAVQGPVVQMQPGSALALRVAGLDRPGLLAQYWAMDTAQNFQQFQAALAQHQVPMFTVMYADREGHIMHLYNGLLPKRQTGDYAFWQGTVPGDTSSTMWTQIHPLSDMPRVVDPPTGWLQNTNDPPWSTTFPMVLNSAAFPAYMAPPQTLSLRTSRSVRMLTEHPKMSLEELIQLKHSTRVELADHILDDVLAEVKRTGSERAKRAAQVLAAWDRQMDANSRGAMLFELFGTRLMQSAPYKTPPDLHEPLTTPKGLRSPGQAVELLDQAAGELEAAFGRLDVPWGEVHRFRLGDVDLPANGASGALGVFRAITYLPTSDHHMAANFGDSYVAAIEFGSPVRAKVLLSYGNSSQPGSKHIGDQLPLLARKELRTAWRTRQEVEANLEERKTF